MEALGDYYRDVVEILFQVKNDQEEGSAIIYDFNIELDYDVDLDDTKSHQIRYLDEEVNLYINDNTRKLEECATILLSGPRDDCKRL